MPHKTSFDIIALWSTQFIGWVVGFGMRDLIEVATLIKEIFAIAAFAAAIWYTIYRVRKDKKKKKE